MAAPPLSLKARALKLLSQREHSRLELQRKLARHCDDEHEVHGVLDELAQRGWLCEERFAESLVHRKASKMGLSRLRQELAQHGLHSETTAQALAGLKESETARAQEVWRKRFGHAPNDMAERAKQIRFLTARGFSSEAVRQVLRLAEEEAAD